MDPGQEVLERIIDLWSKRDAESSAPNFSKQHDISAGNIHHELLQEFTEDIIRSQIAWFLEYMVEREQKDIPPTRREIFLCECCLCLIIAADGVRVTTSLAQDLVRVLPVSIWYRLIRELVSSYLSTSELLQAMLQGLNDHSNPYIMENSLVGLDMYQYRASKDPNSDRTKLLQRGIGDRLEELCQGHGGEIARLAVKAKNELNSYA